MESKGGSAGDGTAAGRCGPDVAELFAAERARLRALCFGFLASDSDAEDAVQETFARAAPRLDAVRENPSGYLAAIARNVCRDELRRRRRIAPGEVHGGVSGSVEDRVLDRVDAGHALSSLGHRDRRVLLAVADGLSPGEIGRLFGVTAVSARQLVSRARRRARVCIDQLGGAVVSVGVQRGGARRGRRSIAGPWMEPLREITAAAAPVVVSVAVAMGGAGSAAPVPPGALQATATAAGAHVDGGPSSLAGGVIRAPGVPTLPATGIWLGGRGTPPPKPTPRPTASGAIALVAPNLADPQQSGIDSLTASPSYPSDHTVFAAGVAADACQQVTSCPALFVSHDGGTNWTALAATGWGRCNVVLSPSFPADHVVMGACPGSGAVRSDDGGSSFHPVLPFATELVADGSSPAADPRLLVLGGSTIGVYHVATQQLSPGPLLATGLLPQAAAVEPASGDVFVAASDAGGHAWLLRCHGSLPCQQLAAVPAGVTALLLSPGFAGDATLIVQSGVSASVSHDGGAGVSPLPVGAGEVRYVQFAGGSVLAVLRQAGAQPSLLVSNDGARSFSTVAGAQPLLAQAYLVLSDGRMLAGLWATQASGAMGIWCSTDQAHSWRRSC